jgi:hypothetical protein
MTEVMPASETLDEHLHTIPVRIVASSTSESVIADVSSFQTIVTIGVGDQAQQLITRAPKRQRAYVRVSAGNASNTTGYVVLGSFAQTQQGLGFRLYNGNDFTYTAKAEVWVRGDNVNSLAVSVEDERYSE